MQGLPVKGAPFRMLGSRDERLKRVEFAQVQNVVAAKEYYLGSHDERLERVEFAHDVLGVVKGREGVARRARIHLLGHEVGAHEHVGIRSQQRCRRRYFVGTCTLALCLPL